jgi:hypothetical protein
MISLQSSEDMVDQNHVLIAAIRKLASTGEQADFSVEEMIELLKTGVSVETLLNLVCVVRSETLISVTKIEEVKDGHRLLPEVQESPSRSNLRLR